ncbi:MAG: dienelactone hydrolase family protein, partial [Chloroflexota bacterium]
DEKKNSQLMASLQQSIYTQKELQASAEDFALISPSNYYKFITAAIQVHHGDSDSIIPVDWSIETCKALRDESRNVECYYYEGAEHTFASRYFKDMGTRVNRFFETYLGN